MASITASATSILRRAKKRFRLIPFLTFFLLKALCSLVMLNFYMGSQISIVHLEEDFIKVMLHKSKSTDKGPNTNTTSSKGQDYVPVVLDSNATTIEKRIAGSGMITPNFSDGTLQGKDRLWNILQTRNVTQVDAEYWASIPTWSTIVKNIRNIQSNIDGADDKASPIIHGLETCEAFQNSTLSDPSQRRIAPAGLFNTGTNYLSVLLEYNCQNPHRVNKYHGNAKRGHGNEWEVPWGKHSPASSRGKYFKNPNLKYTIDEVLPIVLVRNPYGWMKSTCRNPYTAKWKGMRDKKSCPQLKARAKGNGADAPFNSVDVKYGSGTTHHQSLGHLWNDWCGEYFYSNNTSRSNKKTDAPFPRLIVRFEDIIFFPYEVTKQICSCAGGVLGHRQDDKDVANNTFHYVVRSAKAGMGHGPASQRNGLIDSWARYGARDPKDEYLEEETRIVTEILDSAMMSAFGYG